MGSNVELVQGATEASCALNPPIPVIKLDFLQPKKSRKKANISWFCVMMMIFTLVDVVLWW